MPQHNQGEVRVWEVINYVSYSEGNMVKEKVKEGERKTSKAGFACVASQEVNEENVDPVVRSSVPPARGW